MKVLLINGSPRKEGNTYIALKECADELARNLAEMLKKYATGVADKPAPEPWQPMHFIR